jgi:hypothetical protein
MTMLMKVQTPCAMCACNGMKTVCMVQPIALVPIAILIPVWFISYRSFMPY